MAETKTPKSPLTFPLTEWTRPLSAAEREADWKSDLVFPGLSTVFAKRRERIPGVRDTHLPEYVPGIAAFWHPVLPAEVPRCALCTLPNQHGLCRGCTRLLATYPRVAVSSVEFVALSRVDEFPEQFIWDWKDYSAAGGERWGPLPGWYSGWDGISLTMAASLSAYLESHASRLLADDPVITYAPTRAPLIAALLESAREQAWYAPEFVPTGAKAHGFVQHTSTAEERLERRAEDWLVDPDTPVSGRPVLLLDDVFVSGATTFSYAHALRLAGAREVRVVALIRHLRAGHVDYGDALRITRRTRDWSWDPTNCSVAEPARIKKPRRDH